MNETSEVYEFVVQWNLDNPTLFGKQIHIRLPRLSDYGGFHGIVCNDGCVSECGQIVEF